MTERAVPDSCDSNGWRPIETAPKDGTAVLLYADSWELTWGIQAGRFYDGEWMCWGGAVPENDEDGPTHWQPLPPPPTA